MPRKNSKESILDAAVRVIHRYGLAGTTIEAVAIEAGISKGGLFYHFATKKELLLALIEMYEERFYHRRQEMMDAMPDDPDRLLKATVMAGLDHSGHHRVHMSNLVALLDDQHLRERIVASKNRIFAELSENASSPERVALAMLVMDGLWVTEMFGSEIRYGQKREKLISEMMHLIGRTGESIVGTAS